MSEITANQCNDHLNIGPLDISSSSCFGQVPSSFGVGHASFQEVLQDFHRLEPWDDPEVWEMIASGGARAVHHIESPAMIGLCRMCNVREIDGLVAIVSVIRPGAANENKKLAFTRRYQKLEPTTYPHPSLESCLKSTYGMVVYEEHILQICEAFAGLTGGRADVLRRALGKDKRAVIEEIKKEFFGCARAKGRAENEIVEVWELVNSFRGYAFCKAHSTAYGVEAYQSAWLKRYFPVEFMAAVLTNGKGFYQPLVYILECHRMGIRILPPSVNDPGPAFSVVPVAKYGDVADDRSTFPLPWKGEGQGEGSLPFSKAIRIPATRVKGLAAQTKTKMVAERARGPFASMHDFFSRVLPKPEEMELLIKAGAFDCFGKTRTAQFWEHQQLAQFRDRSLSGQGWLFPPPGLNHTPTIPLREPTHLERLQAEAELLDFPATGHPLDLFPGIAWETYCPVAELREHCGEIVTTCGLIVEDRIHEQITGEPMKFLTIADYTGMIETELFAQSYRSYGLATVRYPVLEITAKVEPFENGRGHTLRLLKAGKPRKIEEDFL
jgi:DNA polymerase III alpha subunit